MVVVRLFGTWGPRQSVSLGLIEGVWKSIEVRMGTHQLLLSGEGGQHGVG